MEINNSVGSGGMWHGYRLRLSRLLAADMERFTEVITNVMADFAGSFGVSAGLAVLLTLPAKLADHA